MLYATHRYSTKVSIFTSDILRGTFQYGSSHFTQNGLFIGKGIKIHCVIPISHALYTTGIVRVTVAMRRDFSVRQSRPIFRRHFYYLRVFLTRRSVGGSPTIINTSRNHVNRVGTTRLVSTITSFGRANFNIRLNVPPRTKISHVQHVTVRVTVTLRVPHHYSIVIMGSPTFLVIRRTTHYVIGFLPIKGVRFTMPLHVFFYNATHHVLHHPQL